MQTGAILGWRPHAVWAVIHSFSVGSRRVLHAFPSFTAIVFSHPACVFWLFWLQIQSFSSLRFGGFCMPFRPSLPLCFPIRQACFGCSLGLGFLFCRVQKGHEASGLVDLARLCPSLLWCFPIRQVWFGSSLGCDSKLFCRVQKRRYGVFPSRRCVFGVQLLGGKYMASVRGSAACAGKYTLNIPTPAAEYGQAALVPEVQKPQFWSLRSCKDMTWG